MAVCQTKMPEREVERLRRVALLEQTRLDITRPPTPYRVELVQSRPAAEPLLRLSVAQWQRFECVLPCRSEDIRRCAVSKCRGRLYRL
ncbi:MAG: hypothetical protein NTZ05_08170 [Chloroflexi bacterium]|nr:hypothetical protein [Chloroflexota bacterium]